jgi:hypothetical protein
VTTSHEHNALKLIACHGRANIGNFDEGQRPYLDSLIAAGMVTLRIDNVSHDTLWCYLTDAGREYLLDLNQSTLPMWHDLDQSFEPALDESPVSA